jgi:hypothetical protein
MVNIHTGSSVASSSLKNPCPSGTSIGYMYLTNNSFLNNTILIICNPSFNNNNDDLSENDKLAIGLGLGLGVPCTIIIIALIIYYYITVNNNRFASNKTSSVPITPETIEQIKIKVKNNVIERLPYKLYLQFVEGNLSIELKKELGKIKDTGAYNIKDFVDYARECNHEDMAKWINNLTFTTLQNEGIV